MEGKKRTEMLRKMSVKEEETDEADGAAFIGDGGGGDDGGGEGRRRKKEKNKSVANPRKLMKQFSLQNLTSHGRFQF